MQPSQSNVIFGVLFVAFVIFITQRGELPTYLGFLFNPQPSSKPLSASDVKGDTSSFGGGADTSSYGQAKANTYFNAIMKWLPMFLGG